MSKHVIDHPRTNETSRLSQQYTRIETDQKQRPQSAALQQRPRKDGPNSRLKAFTRIERQSG